MKFTAEVELGNAEMYRPADVMHAIVRALAKQTEPWEKLEAGMSGSLSDINGNTVGTWEVED